MKIALKGPSISCCREVLRQTKSVQEQAECIVPDVYEDIGLHQKLKRNRNATSRKPPITA